VWRGGDIVVIGGGMMEEARAGWRKIIIGLQSIWCDLRRSLEDSWLEIFDVR